jgi:predicted metal-dependent peptidase
MSKKKFDLNRHTARLLMNEPFFASLSRCVDKVETNVIPTAAMRLDDDGFFSLLYNPEYFAKLSDEEMADVLKHEFYHIIFDHVTGRLPDAKVTPLWNFATDLAINSHLKNLPDGALIPGEGDFEDIPKYLSAEQYHAELKKRKKKEEKQKKSGEQKEGKNLSDVEEFDDHSGWGESSSGNRELAKERLKGILKEAAKEAQQSGGWGSVPESIKKDILSSVESTMNWRAVLRYFIKTSQKTKKSSTVKRINRRYPYLHPGRKSNRQANIAISIDQSGSVGDGLLVAFFAELSKLSEIATFTVVPFDTEVSEKDVFVWKKGERVKPKRFLTGGTCFDAPTDYVNERDFDGHIVLTDMYAPKPGSSKCQRMWMTTPSCAKKPYFETKERVVAINYDSTY